MADWASIQAERDAIYASGGKPVLKPPDQRDTGSNYASVTSLQEAREVMRLNPMVTNPVVHTDSQKVIEDQSQSQKTNLDPVPLANTIKPLSLEGNMTNGIITPYQSPTSGITASPTGLGDIFSNLPLLLLFMMMGKGNGGGMSGMLMMILMMSMMGGGDMKAGQLGNINVQEAFAWSLLPKMGTLTAFLLGGVSGLMGQSMKSSNKKTKTRYRTRYVYRNRYYRRRY